MNDMSMMHAYHDIQVNTTIYLPQMADVEFNRFRDGIGDTPTLDSERLWNIYLMAKQSLRVPGCFFECGVYAGGTALFLAQIMEGSNKMLHLFDTFCGMPKVDPERDWHLEGQFNDAPLAEVRKTVGHEGTVFFHEGVMPGTFAGKEDAKIAFAHIDTDLYQSTLDCCEFVYPRMAPGGVIVLDDYGQISCDGATSAIDEFFAGKKEVPLPLVTKQAIVFKMP